MTLREKAPFLVRPEYLSVLSGTDEGVYGWLSINFLAQRLKGMRFSAYGTIGALEVGGASAQVILIPER